MMWITFASGSMDPISAMIRSLRNGVLSPTMRLFVVASRAPRKFRIAARVSARTCSGWSPPRVQTERVIQRFRYSASSSAR